jgi:putative oxidoreductase
MNSQAVPALIGRVLLAVMFLGAAVDKFTGLEGTAGFIASAGLPVPTLLAVGAGLLELLGAAMLIVGWQARWAALALAGFTLIASVVFHSYWAMPKAEQMVPMLLFMKNMAIIGGLLMVYAFGPGSLSLDARRAA